MTVRLRKVDQRVYCNCGEGFWRYPIASPGLSAVKKKCASCDQQKMIVLRAGETIDVVDLSGDGLGDIREALETSSELNRTEVELLMASLRPHVN